MSNRPPREAFIRRGVVGGCGNHVQRENCERLVVMGGMGMQRIVVDDPVRNDSSGVNRARCIIRPRSWVGS